MAKKDDNNSEGREPDNPKKIDKGDYSKELRRLQVELAHLQDWVKKTQQRIIVVFEGRDAAGKGGVIKAITERVSPRVFRTVALPAPSDREKSQWYTQRYITQFPAGGEVVLFDRSWYNRAGVEPVMDFCTQDQYERFLRTTPSFEREMIQSGTTLIKYFFDVSQKEQEKRFNSRMNDPIKYWKLSPIDLESRRRWWDYTAAYQRMVDVTDTDESPWYRVQADDKHRARLNCISHLLSLFPYEEMQWDPPVMSEIKEPKPGTPKTIEFRHQVPAVY